MKWPIFLLAFVASLFGLPVVGAPVPVYRPNPITTNTPIGMTNVIVAIAGSGGGGATGFESNAVTTATPAVMTNVIQSIAGGGTATNVVWPVAGQSTKTRTNGLAVAVDITGVLTNNTSGRAGFVNSIASNTLPATQITGAPWVSSSNAQPDFTIVQWPDPQFAATVGTATWTSNANWIIAHKTEWNILALACPGDTINNGAIEGEYTYVTNLFWNIKKAGIQLWLTAGNHDSAAGDWVPWNTHYPLSFFQYDSSYRGGYTGTENIYPYWTVTNSGLKLLVIGAPYWVNTANVPWISNTFAAYPDHIGIFICHSILNGAGQISTTDNDIYYQTGDMLWTNVLAACPNVMQGLCGHNIFSGQGKRFTGTGASGQQVDVLMFNSQTNPVTSGGQWARLYRYQPSQARILAYDYDISTCSISNSPFVMSLAGRTVTLFAGNGASVSNAVAFVPGNNVSASTADAGRTFKVSAGYLKDKSVDAGLVFHAALNEGTGTNTFDSGPYGLESGYLGGGVWVAQSNSYLGYSYDCQSNTAIVFSNTAPFSTISNKLTVGVWFCPTNSMASGLTRAETLFARMNTSLAGEWALARGPSSHELYWYVNAGTAIQFFADPTITLNAWHHMAFTYDGANAVGYFDGVPVKTNALSGNITFSTQSTTLGNNSGKFASQGWAATCKLDEAKVWNRALTEEELRVIAGLGPKTFVASNVVAAVTGDLSNGTNINGSSIASGTVPADRLGSSGGAGKFLRYDNTWQSIAGGGDMLAANNLSDVANKATALLTLGGAPTNQPVTFDQTNRVTGSGNWAIIAADGETPLLKVDDSGNFTFIAGAAAGPASFNGSFTGLNTGLTNASGQTIAQEIAAGATTLGATNTSGYLTLTNGLTIQSADAGYLTVSNAAGTSAVVISGSNSTVTATTFAGTASTALRANTVGNGSDTMVRNDDTTLILEGYETDVGSNIVKVIAPNGIYLPLTNGILCVDSNGMLRLATIGDNVTFNTTTYTLSATGGTPTAATFSDGPTIASTNATSCTVTATTDLSLTNLITRWSTDSSYDNSTNTTAGGTSHSQGILGLTAGTTYNLRMEAWRDGLSTTSSVVTFETYVAAPTISAGPTVSGTNATDATITWTTTTAADSRIRWSTNSDLADAWSTNSASTATDHTFGISNLIASTTYYYGVYSTNISGGVASATNNFATPASAWTPASLGSQLKIWLKNEDLSGNDGAAVGYWADSSGNSWPATNATAAQQPYVTNTGTFGSAKSVSFNGTDRMLFLSNAVSVANNVASCSIVAAVQMREPSAGGDIFNVNRNVFSSSRFLLYVSSVTPRAVAVYGRRLDSEGSATSSTLSAALDAGAFVLQGDADWQSDTAYAWTNCTPIITDDDWFGSYSGGANSAATDSAMVVLGASGSTEFYNGWIAEVMVAVPKLSAENRTNVYNYLKGKFWP